MSDVKVSHRAAGVGRLGTVAAWISAVCCLPYLVLKLLWTLDIPVGIADRSVLDSNGWVAGTALMALLQLAGLVLVLALTMEWARRLPAWLVLFPVWVGTGLLFQVSVGAVLVGVFSASSQDSNATTSGIQLWVYVMVYAAFAGQGAALAIAFACHVRARWGRLMGERTGEVLARRAARARSWAELHLAETAVVLAWMAVAMALVPGYWAAGGSFGIAGPHPPAGLQAGRVVGAVTAAVGLLALAGRWGSRTRFWLPAALTWLGSGALAAFDGLVLALNQLFGASGTDAAEAGWSLLDAVLAIKVVIGVLVAAVGVVAVKAAADRRPIGLQATPSGTRVRLLGHGRGG